MIHRFAQFVCCGLLALLSAVAATEPIAVVHAEMNGDEINRRVVRQVFLGMKNTWEKAPVTLVLSREAGGEAAVQEITGRSYQRLLRGWKRIAFSGNGVMPIVVDTNAQALALVAETRGAIVLFMELPAEMPESLVVKQLEAE